LADAPNLARLGLRSVEFEGTPPEEPLRLGQITSLSVAGLSEPAFRTVTEAVDFSAVIHVTLDCPAEEDTTEINHWVSRRAGTLRSLNLIRFGPKPLPGFLAQFTALQALGMDFHPSTGLSTTYWSEIAHPSGLQGMLALQTLRLTDVDPLHVQDLVLARAKNHQSPIQCLELVLPDRRIASNTNWLAYGRTAWLSTHVGRLSIELYEHKGVYDFQRGAFNI
jgi:hypothetical protein